MHGVLQSAVCDMAALAGQRLAQSAGNMARDGRSTVRNEISLQSKREDRQHFTPILAASDSTP